MTAPKESILPPVPLAYLLCDQVIEDGHTGKKCLIGIFDRVSVISFPTEHKPCALYFRGADCEGTLEILVKYVRSDNQEVLAEATATINVAQRGDMEFSMVLPPIRIPEPGQYEFQLFMNGQYIHRVRFTAVKRDSNKES